MNDDIPMELSRNDLSEITDRKLKMMEAHEQAIIQMAQIRLQNIQHEFYRRGIQYEAA